MQQPGRLHGKRRGKDTTRQEHRAHHDQASTPRMARKREVPLILACPFRRGLCTLSIHHRPPALACLLPSCAHASSRSDCLMPGSLGVLADARSGSHFLSPAPCGRGIGVRSPTAAIRTESGPTWRPARESRERYDTSSCIAPHVLSVHDERNSGEGRMCMNRRNLHASDVIGREWVFVATVSDEYN